VPLPGVPEGPDVSIGGDPIGNTPEQFAAEIREDISRWSKIVKDTGLKME
jgi:tripartite-type tricarboxylate transporter receptor subunit TctC